MNINDESRVYETDNYIDTANKIFNHFEINQSCNVIGWTYITVLDEYKAKGELVLKELEDMDRKQNFDKSRSDRRVRRRRVKLPNSIGDYVAQKIFRWKIDKSSINKPKYAIWRVQ